ncbi:hypothetical protein ACFCXS_27590 [Streptomyces sp. NPDC056373]
MRLPYRDGPHEEAQPEQGRHTIGARDLPVPRERLVGPGGPERDMTP